MTDKKMDGKFYSDGRTVFRAAKSETSNGTENISLGFPVCTICPGAPDIAASLIEMGLNELLEQEVFE